MLWTGSVDQTIRIWNPATSQCERELTHRNNGPGHTAAVTCLLVLPPTPQQAAVHIASGGMDGTMRLWSTTGEFIHQVAHESEVMCMTTFYSDPQGMCPSRPILLSSCSLTICFFRHRNPIDLIRPCQRHHCRAITKYDVLDLPNGFCRDTHGRYQCHL